MESSNVWESKIKTKIKISRTKTSRLPLSLCVCVRACALYLDFFCFDACISVGVSIDFVARCMVGCGGRLMESPSRDGDGDPTAVDKGCICIGRIHTYLHAFNGGAWLTIPR